MYQLAEIHNDQSRKLHYFSNQLTLLEAMDLNRVRYRYIKGEVQISDTSSSGFTEFDQLVEMKRF